MAKSVNDGEIDAGIKTCALMKAEYHQIVASTDCIIL